MAKSLLLSGVAFVFHSYTPLYPYFIAFCFCSAGPFIVLERALINSETLTESSPGSATDQENNCTVMVSF